MGIQIKPRKLFGVLLMVLGGLFIYLTLQLRFEYPQSVASWDAAYLVALVLSIVLGSMGVALLVD